MATHKIDGAKCKATIDDLMEKREEKACYSCHYNGKGWSYPVCFACLSKRIWKDQHPNYTPKKDAKAERIKLLKTELKLAELIKESYENKVSQWMDRTNIMSLKILQLKKKINIK